MKNVNITLRIDAKALETLKTWALVQSYRNKSNVTHCDLIRSFVAEKLATDDCVGCIARINSETD